MDIDKQTQIPAMPTIPLPSADLIVYRFDQMDKSLSEVKNQLGMLTSTFITKEEALALKEERDAKFREIERRLESNTWYVRAAISAAFIAFFGAIASLLLMHLK